MTQPPGPDETTGPAQPSEPVPPADSGQPRETAPPEESTPTAAAPPPVPPSVPPAVPPTVPPVVPGYPTYPGQAAPGGYPAQPGAPQYPGAPGVPQYPAGGYDQSQPYPAQYDPSQPYVLYQAVPTGGMHHGQLADGDPLISPDYSGWWQRSLAIVKQGWRSLAVLQAIGFAVSLLVSVPQAVLLLNMTDELNEMSRGPATDPVTGAPVTPDFGPILAVLGMTVVGAFVGILVSFVVAIACNHVAVSVAAGLRPRIGAALGLAARRVFPLLGWQVLAGLILLVGVCACFLPAIYLSAVFMVLPAVVTFERGGSAISRCFRLFHVDLGASISRIATVAGISIGIGVVAYIVDTIIQMVPGPVRFDPNSTSVFGGADTASLIAAVAGAVVADLLARAGAVFTAPLTLATYADLRGRVEPLSTATLANEAGLAPAYPQPSGGQEPGPPPAGPEQPDSDWMPPNR